MVMLSDSRRTAYLYGAIERWNSFAQDVRTGMASGRRTVLRSGWRTR